MADINEILNELDSIRQDNKLIFEELQILDNRVNNFENIYFKQLKDEIEELKRPDESNQSDRRLILAALMLVTIALVSIKLTISRQDGELSWEVQSGITDTLIVRILEYAGIAAVFGVSGYALLNVKKPQD
jgi:hypothetical protein